MYTVNHWPKHISMIFTSNHKFYRDEDDKINFNEMKKKIINWSAKHWQRSDSYFNSEGTTDLWILIKMHLSKSYHTMYQQQSNNWCFLFISLRRILGKADDFRTVEKSYVNIFFLQLKKKNLLATFCLTVVYNNLIQSLCHFTLPKTKT